MKYSRGNLSIEFIRNNRTEHMVMVVVRMRLGRRKSFLLSEMCAEVFRDELSQYLQLE